MGAIRWPVGARDWNDDLRSVRAAQGAPAQARVRAGPPGCGRKGAPGQMRRLLYLTAGVLCAITIAGAQPLQQHLQELKQQYAETTRSLDQQIAAMAHEIVRWTSHG